MPYLSKILCPYCDYVFTAKDMVNGAADLWAIAPDETTVEEKCPYCGKEFFISGTYSPLYKPAKTEEELG